MTYVGPVLLDATHNTANFDCGKPALNVWLRTMALSNQKSRTSRTWVVLDGDTGIVVAFYASCTASITKSTATAKAGHRQPQEIPAILLARMAVDEKHHHQGLGGGLLKHCVTTAMEISERVGVRLLLVHAKDDEAKSFYMHYDFEASPIDELTLMLVLP